MAKKDKLASKAAGAQAPVEGAQAAVPVAERPDATAAPVASAASAKKAAVAAAPKTRNTVNVACKLPHGLVLQLFALGKTEDEKPIMRPASDPVTLKGANSSSIIGGFGLTEVPADFWDAWMAQNKTHPAIRGGMIFAHERREFVADKALDHKGARTGLERIDPNNTGIPGIKAVPDADLKANAALQSAL